MYYSIFNKKLFYDCIQKIKKYDKNIKIKIYRKSFSTPGGATGEYGANLLEIATGEDLKNERKNWKWLIGTLAHEFAHYLREKRYSKYHNDRTYNATSVLYSKNATKRQRISAAKTVLLDEYETDAEAVDVLESWGISVKEHYKDWWYWTNCYNVRIKYLLETGLFYREDGDYDIIGLPNKKFTKRQILAKLPRKIKSQIDKLIEKKIVTVTIINYHEGK